MLDNNRAHVAKNPYQGTALKVLCICSAGCLRSPTAANVLHIEKGFNTRSAGVHDYAIIPVDEVLIHWADLVVFMEDIHHAIYDARFGEFIRCMDPENIPAKVILDIPDNYQWNDHDLKKLILERFDSKYSN